MLAFCNRSGLLPKHLGSVPDPLGSYRYPSCGFMRLVAGRTGSRNPASTLASVNCGRGADPPHARSAGIRSQGSLRICSKIPIASSLAGRDEASIRTAADMLEQVLNVRFAGCLRRCQSAPRRTSAAVAARFDAPVASSAAWPARGLRLPSIAAPSPC